MHNPIPTDVPDTFWDRVSPTGFCWEWTGGRRRHGYGYISLKDTQYLAHRVAYALLVGDPGEMMLDHLCRNTGCVNPDHLQPVTSKENTLRGYSPVAQFARSATCASGHILPTEPNEDGNRRRCLECRRRVSRESAQRRRARRQASPLVA